MALTDSAIRSAKPAEKPYRLSDAAGLYLEVSPGGGKWWRFKYRAGGKEKRLSLGTYPDVPLRSARQQLADLRAPELLPMLRRIESRGAGETAHRVKQNCGQVFRHAVATGRAERDPTGDLRGALPPTRTKHHASIVDPKGVGQLLRAIDGYEGHFVTKCALRLAPLVFVRPDAPRFVFPGGRSRERPMSENAVLAALRRMGYTKDEMTGHGFRSMASTLLHEQGWNHQAVERQLAHAERNAVSAAYNFAEHLPERRRMMQAWADYLDGLRSGAVVVPLFRAANDRC